jgi:hypothetical protein
MVENFVLGSDTDKQCKDPKTFSGSVGASRLKTMLKKAGVTLNPSLKKTLENAAGKEFVASVTVEKDDGSRDPKYKGRERNRISAFFSIGEHKPSAPTGDEDDDDDGEDDEEKQEDGDDDDDDEDDED